MSDEAVNTPLTATAPTGVTADALMLDATAKEEHVATAGDESGSSEKHVPAGFQLHTESTTSILFRLPSTTTSTSASPSTKPDPHAKAPVFLNPVQQYNRDLSIVAIRTWSEVRNQEKKAIWEVGQKKKADKARKGKRGRDEKGAEGAAKKVKVAEGEEVLLVAEEGGGEERLGDSKGAEMEPKVSLVEEGTLEQEGEMKIESSETTTAPPAVAPVVHQAPSFKFTCLEALSATGLRAIRYAKEIPLLQYVVANDLSASAVDDIKRNIEWNDLAPPPPSATSSSDIPPRYATKKDEASPGKIRVSEGDACSIMYSHRADNKRFDCVDLDPYGSAVPFLDAAIGATADGGLLCVTCTDLGVLAGHNYPEKAFSLYGGVSANVEYCHEVALRLALHSIATTAGHYGRYIEPLLSLSIDFYIRVFVRVHTGPKEVKNLASKTGILYYCHDCQSRFTQLLGRTTERVSKGGVTNYLYQNSTGPPPGVGEACGECGGRFHVAGPMWMGKLHDVEFVGKMLGHIQENPHDFATAARIEGMLSVAQSELEAPFYFTPGRLSGSFHCTSPSLVLIVNALLNGGYKVSRAHAAAGSLKTNAPHSFVFDILREWIKTNPVKMENVKEGSPTRKLLQKDQTAEVSFAHNSGSEAVMMNKVKVVRYQVNPEPNWGPGKAAHTGARREKKEE